ncbi:MAG: hypothetical protein M1834_006790 [Cirrosporium novae-zelandiae]|nr:MAG: hypothetical protein M1834_006790 [Cirrosporium novae-zelandiae]
MANSDNVVPELAADHSNHRQSPTSRSADSTTTSHGNSVEIISSTDRTSITPGDDDKAKPQTSSEPQEIFDIQKPLETPGLNINPSAAGAGESISTAVNVADEAEYSNNIITSDHEDKLSTGTDLSGRNTYYRNRYHGYLRHKRFKEPLGERVRKASKRVNQYRDYIMLMEDRVSALEGKHRCFSPEGGSEKTDSQPERIPRIPQLNRVKWANFKAKRSAPEEQYKVCAIDVLVGEAVINQDLRRRSGMVNTDVCFAPLSPNSGATAPTLDMAKDTKNITKLTIREQCRLPERIRINSLPLIRILEKIHKGTIIPTDCPFLIFRPFRILVYYEEEIQEWFQRLERKWNGVLKNPSADAAPESPSESKEVIGDNSEKVCHPPCNIDSSSINDDMQVSTPGSDDHENDDEFPECTGTEEALNDLRCLIDFIEKDIKPVMHYFNGSSCQKISFDELWYLFKPGDEVLASGSYYQAYRVTHITGVRHHPNITNIQNRDFHFSKLTPVVIHCVYMDFNGKRLGPVSKTFKISKYDGEREILSLPVYPFRFSKDASSLREELIERGKTFMKLTEVKHVHYTGISLDTQEEIDSQAIIDFEQTIQHIPQWEPAIIHGSSEEADIGDSITDEDRKCDVIGCCEDEYTHDDSYVDKDWVKEFIQQQPTLTIYSRPINTITEKRDEELVLLTNRILGFVLRSRKWVSFTLLTYSAESKIANLDINCIREVAHVKDADGFDLLVLPKGHKEMVRSLVKQHFREKKHESWEKEQIDLVRGKGKGLILLLHGAPGVGKTSTAECVADSFRKPLFPITCGDLGVTASEVESSLEMNFTLAHRWGCILLLDEADIFLAQRTRDDFIRNSLVSVFLRVLEYYAGILFLTTNRVGSFDEAFKSRIHISLYYPPLDKNSTVKVWEMNLKRTKSRMNSQLLEAQKNENGKGNEDKGNGEKNKKKAKYGQRRFKIDKDGIIAFSEEHFNNNAQGRWNGRQIRNAFQTAIALAESEAQDDTDSEEEPSRKPRTVKLRRRHFETVAEASLAFDKYLEDVYGGLSASQRAYDAHIRYDEFGAPPPPSVFSPPNQYNPGASYSQPRFHSTTGPGPWSLNTNYPSNSGQDPPKQPKSKATASKSKKRRSKGKSSSEENDRSGGTSSDNSSSNSASTSDPSSDPDSDVRAKKQKKAKAAATEKEGKKKKDSKSSKKK